jgi:enediyne biosynthesis protein E4
LGKAATVDGVEVRWPGGAVEHVNLPGVDRFFVIEEGKGLVPSVYDAIATNNVTKSVPPTMNRKGP